VREPGKKNGQVPVLILLLLIWTGRRLEPSPLVGATGNIGGDTGGVGRTKSKATDGDCPENFGERTACSAPATPLPTCGRP
jgi:hypothetical protein